MFKWDVVYDGKTAPPGAAVGPMQRLSWGRTAGLGAQHVVAMFGATFVFPIVMGLNPQLAVMMSGIATIVFLLIVQGRVPSYLGTSASFVGGVAAIRAQGGDSADVTGAILIAGAVLAIIGVLIHFLGSAVLHKVLPPVVTGAVVMLIGFNLAPVVATIYWPQDQWVALATMVFVMVVAVGARGFVGRIAVFLGLIFGYVLSWVLDLTVGPITSVLGGAIAADGFATVLTSSVGGSPTTTYAENIGVMAATRIYSTAAYYVAALVAILYGLSPKFGAVVSATPGGVLGGITVVLYGMIGLLGAKIWKENGVDFGNPINLVPVAAGIIIAIGNTTLKFTNNFQLAGIALGTIVTIGAYHLARAIAPPHLREQQRGEGAVVVVDAPGAYREEPTAERN